MKDRQVFDQKEQVAGALRSLTESDLLMIVPEGRQVEVGSLMDVTPVS